MRAMRVGAALAFAVAVVARAAWAAASGPAADLSGTVFLPNGRPAAGMTVRAVGSMTQLLPSRTGRRAGEQSFGDFGIRFATDAQGRYRTRLDPRDRSAHRPPPWPEEAHAFWGLAFMCAGGYAPVNADVSPGQREVKRDLHLQPGDRISGRAVAAATGRPIAGATVHVLTDIGWPIEFSTVKADARGRFVVPDQLPPGVYQLGADAKEWALLATRPPRDEPAKPADRGRARQITFRLVPRSFLVHVLVLQADGRPLRNASVQGWLVEASLGPGIGGDRIGPWPQPTDEHGGFTYQESSGPDVDRNRPWALAYPYTILSVEYQGHQSNAVKIDRVHPPSKPVVLRLK